MNGRAINSGICLMQRTGTLQYCVYTGGADANTPNSERGGQNECVAVLSDGLRVATGTFIHRFVTEVNGPDHDLIIIPIAKRIAKAGIVYYVVLNIIAS